MKFLFFILCIIYMWGRVNAQSSPSDINVVNVDRFGYAPSSHAIHNQLYLNVTSPLDPGHSLWYIPEDPSFGSNLQLSLGMNGPIYFPADGTNKIHSIPIRLLNPQGAIVETHSNSFTLKATFPNNNIGFEMPTEIWDINSTATWSPTISSAFPSGSPYNGSALSGGTAYIKLAPSNNGKLKKPLIFVDGLDFNSNTYTYNGQVIRHGSTGWDVLTLGNDAGPINPIDQLPSEFKDYPASMATILGAGYDIIFLDFASGADYIQKNGLVLVKLIEMVNARRAIDDPSNAETCMNAVLGASMGGQVAKWAITYMEANNIPHKCHTYISFDSPQRGANIPLGIQAAAFLTALTGGSTDNWDILNAPAARQMVLESLEGAVTSGRVSMEMSTLRVDFSIPPTLGFTFYEENVTPNFGFAKTNEIRTSFKSEIQSMGYPKNTRNVGISCGTFTGEQLPFNAGDQYFNAGYHIDPSGIGGNLACNDAGHVFSFVARALNGGNEGIDKLLVFDTAPGLGGCATKEVPYEDNTLFLAAVPTDFDNWVGSNVPPTEYFILRLKAVEAYPSFDNSPGCTRGDLLSIEKGINDQDPAIQVVVNQKYTTFMPTLSLLDIDWSMTDEFLIKDFDQNDESWVMEHTPFDAVYAPAENLRHIELTSGMVAFILEQMEEGFQGINVPDISLTAGIQYNYGKKRKLVPDVVIYDGGKLSVNTQGRTNYMSASDPLADLPLFQVYTGGGCESNRTVTVKNGGILQIGDPNVLDKTGIFHAMKDAVIHIESGGTLRISNNSTLLIYAGARLILDSGAIVTIDKTDGKIDMRGTLVINGDFNFSGFGYINYAGDIEFGANATRFRMIGHLPYHRCLRTEVPLTLPVGKDLLLNRGAVECVGGGVGIKGSSAASCSNFKFYGSGTGLFATGSGDVYLSSCLFVGIDRPISISNTAIPSAGNSNVTANGCTFSNFRDGALVSRRNLVNFTGCSFTNTDASTMNGAYALFSNQNFSLILRNSTISGLSSPSTAPHYFNAGDMLGDAGLAEGLRVRGGFQAWVDGGTISGCNIGIGSRSITGVVGEAHLPANLLLTNMLTIRDCIAGVCAEGDAASGVIIASCTKFIDNQFAIGGADMTLLIDPSQLNPTPQFWPYPNHFVRPGSFVGSGGDNRYISMCFPTKNPGSSIMATNNFFGAHNINNYTIIEAATLPQLLSLASFDVRRPNANGGTCTAGFTSIPVVTIPGSAMPRECNDAIEACVGDNNCIRDCPMEVATLEATTIRARFLEGLQDIYAEDTDAATDGFDPLSKMWQPEIPNTWEVECRAFVQAARSFVNGAGERAGERSNNMHRQKTGSNFTLAPNPATSEVRVGLPASGCDIWITDALGRLVFQQTVAQTAVTIATSAWPSGAYFVRVINNGDSQEQKILMIQR